MKILFVGERRCWRYDYGRQKWCKSKDHTLQVPAHRAGKRLKITPMTPGLHFWCLVRCQRTLCIMSLPDRLLWPRRPCHQTMQQLLSSSQEYSSIQEDLLYGPVSNRNDRGESNSEHGFSGLQPGRTQQVDGEQEHVKKRISRACDRCNISRRKCDGKKPCAYCVRESTPVQCFQLSWMSVTPVQTFFLCFILLA